MHSWQTRGGNKPHFAQHRDSNLFEYVLQTFRCCIDGDTLLLAQVIDTIMAHPLLGRNLTAPSISAGSDNLYMRGDCKTRADCQHSYGGAICMPVAYAMLSWP